MKDMLLNGAYQTTAIASIAKPATARAGRARGLLVLHQLVDQRRRLPVRVAHRADVGHRPRRGHGRDARQRGASKGINGWYAPAINLHRSPFGGRDFEYYSEDPLLSGAMLTATANAAAENGVYTTLKHFALNEQETNRVNNGLATWATEQTVSELYLKPFEMAVKDITMDVEYCRRRTARCRRPPSVPLA